MTKATPRTTPSKKMNLYFTVEFRRCLDLFSASIGLRTCSSLTCNASIHFQMKYEKLAAVVHVFQDTQNQVISRCCLADGG